MAYYKIVDSNPQQYFCKTCQRAMGTLFKIDGKSYCPKCVPSELINKCKIVNQNREEIK